MKAYKKVDKVTIATLENCRDSQAKVETAVCNISTFVSKDKNLENWESTKQLEDLTWCQFQ
jgi:hypothetical protein